MDGYFLHQVCVLSGHEEQRGLSSCSDTVRSLYKTSPAVEFCLSSTCSFTTSFTLTIYKNG